MEHSQTKTVLVNIVTGVVVVGLLAVGYFVFVKKETLDIGQVAATSLIADETATIGTEINGTVRDLKNLELAVASSTIIFELPEFKNLEDFSVSIPPESVGRENPFVPTGWKLKLKALEETMVKTTDSAPPSTVPQAHSATVTSSLGDFSGNSNSASGI